MPALTLQHVSSSHHKPRDYAQTPLNIYWEMTQACALACRHCRAEAVPNGPSRGANFEESVAFLRQIGDFGDPLPQLILTGGDPLARKDLYELIDEARKLGIGVSITPAATPALTREVLVRLKEHGVEGLGLEPGWLDCSAPRFHPRRPRHVRPHHAGHPLGAGTRNAAAGEHAGGRRDGRRRSRHLRTA